MVKEEAKPRENKFSKNKVLICRRNGRLSANVTQCRRRSSSGIFTFLSCIFQVSFCVFFSGIFLCFFQVSFCVFFRVSFCVFSGIFLCFFSGIFLCFFRYLFVFLGVFLFFSLGTFCVSTVSFFHIFSQIWKWKWISPFRCLKTQNSFLSSCEKKSSRHHKLNGRVFWCSLPSKLLNSEVSCGNGCCDVPAEPRRCKTCVPVSGNLPNTGWQVAALRLLHQHWVQLLLLRGHQGGGRRSSGNPKEEEDPLNAEARRKEERRVSEEETQLSNCWESIQVWPMWQHLQIGKRREDPHRKSPQECEINPTTVWSPATAARQSGNQAYFPPLGCHQGGSRGWEGGASLSPSTTPPSRVGSGGHLSTMRQEALQLYVLCCGGVLRLLLSIRPEVQKIATLRAATLATLVINISVIRS